MTIINIDGIASTEIASDEDKYYLPKVSKKIEYWKRISVKFARPRLVFKKERWSSMTDYIIFCALFGNSVDFLPVTVTIAVHVACGIWNTVLILSTFLFAMPMIYVESFLGRYTRSTNGQLYKLAPIFFGYTVMIFIINCLYLPLKTSDLIVLAMHLFKMCLNPMYIHECDEYAEDCYDYNIQGPINKTDCVKVELAFACDGQIYRYISAYNHWDTLESSMSLFRVRGFVLMLILVLLVNLLSLASMKAVGNLLKLLFIFNMIFHLAIFFMAILMSGGFKVFENLMDFSLENYGASELITTIYYSTARMGIMSPSGYMTYANANHTNNGFGSAVDTLIIVSLNMLLNLFYVLVYLTVIDGLANVFMVDRKNILVELIGIYVSVIPEFLKFRGCPNIFIDLFLFTTILMEAAKLSILLRLHLVNLFEYVPQIVPYKSYIRIIGAFFFIVIIMTFSLLEYLGLYIFLCDMYILQGIKLLGESTMIFYIYGVSRLDDDYHFFYGCRPIKFWRVMWYVYPVVMFLCTVLMIIFDVQGNKTNIKWEGGPTALMVRHLGIAIVAVWLVIIFSSTVIYIMATLKKVHTVKLLSPLFNWGPPDLERRKARKLYAPRTSIRSEPPIKKKTRWRMGSIRKMHDMDMASNKRKGYIFMDSSFFTNIDTLQDQQAKDRKIKVHKLLI